MTAPMIAAPDLHVSRGFVLGTAGHVDHGKSTLVKALTGIDPDRLAEEKARSMTIDLGFAWLSLPSGRSVSIVDVPGHERFIKNMLAGVGGIDAALLIIAADEGPMPQTMEHLAILDLLQVERGLVVMTKTDTIDGDWLDLVQEEVKERLRGTVLAGAPIVPVSALTGIGLETLLGEVDQLLASAPDRQASMRPRLPIDRIFTVAGFGTVVTGTLIDGALTIGQELRVFPDGPLTRVRGLQTHQTKVDRALPGSRVAVNLSGLAVDGLRRGQVLAPPAALIASQRLDVHLRLLADAPTALKQNDEIDFFCGAMELPARLTLLDREQLDPGETGWVQLRFREPVAVLRGDRFIVRRASPSMTIGGGSIVDATPPRHRRFRPEVLGALETLAAGSSDEIVLHLLEAGPREVRTLRGGRVSGLTDQQVDQALVDLIAEGDVRLLGVTHPVPRPADRVVATITWETLRSTLRSIVGAHHQDQPLRRGMPKEQLRSRLGLTAGFDDVVAAAVSDGAIIDGGQTVRLPAFTITLSSAQRAVADRFLGALDVEPYAPPSPSDFGLDIETLGALEDLGEIVRVGDGVVFGAFTYETIVRTVLELIDQQGSLTLAGFRDHFRSSRKFAQATLEHLDQRRVTRRVGDERVRFPGFKLNEKSGS
jgi:selenocysteine-specific elongation factor